MKKISIELTLEDEEAGRVFSRWIDASGLAWTLPDADSGEPYKALKREGTENLIVGTAIVAPTGYFKTDAQIVAESKAVIEAIGSERRWYLERRQLPDLIRDAITRAGKEGDNAVKDMKSMLDNVIAHLRAMEIVAESVSDAGTHKEKDARLRGMIDVIGRAIQRATEFSYDFGHRHWPTYRDLFKSDFPTREIMQELHNKDAEIKRLQIKAGEAEPEVAVKVEDDNIF